MEFFVLAFIAFVIIAIAMGYYAKKQAEERALAIASFADAAGLEYAPVLSDSISGGFFEQLFGDRSASDEGRFLARFQGYKPFGQGHSPEVCNLVYGRRGEIDWAIFDYTYKVTSSNGKSTSTTTYHWSVVCARIPVLLPAMTLEPENFLHRVGSKLGMRELTFEVEEFNRKYFVRCDQERLAYDLLHPGMIEFLLAQPARLWQIGGYQIVLGDSRLLPVSDLKATMSEVEGLVERIPPYFREDRGIAPNWESPLES
ncbi:MAG TPA: hypothetical protein VEX38_09520 [Fimbriimonadaceae bacterium]|nr:hypothetical protein [Fimbriimonadaceae bacterium]